MKKKLLALGSALIFLASTAQADAGDMGFGLKAGGSLFLPTVGSTQIGGQNYEGSINLFPSGKVFFDYEMIDTLKLGLDAGYSRKGFYLKKENGTDDTQDYSLYIHAIDIAVPLSYLPMEREGGLSLFLGPKVYLPFMKSEKLISASDATSPTDAIVTGFNIGATVGVDYEIMESGLSIGANYDFFFMSTISSEANIVNTRLQGLSTDSSYFTQGVEATIGYNFARLME